jgi:hypothetical protein
LPIPGIEGACASPDGRIFTRWRAGSYRRISKTWKRATQGSHCKSGAANVTVNGIRSYVGRLILLTFVGPAPTNTECCHNDGNPSNNAIGNLRWDTRQGNVNDTLKHGRTSRGESSGAAKLTDAKVRAIRSLAATGWTQERLARRYRISRPTISCVLSGKTWTHIPMGPPPVRKTHKLTAIQRDEIASLYLSGMSRRAVAGMFHVDPTYVWQLTRRTQPCLQQSTEHHHTRQTYKNNTRDVPIKFSES